MLTIAAAAPIATGPGASNCSFDPNNNPDCPPHRRAIDSEA